MSYQTEAREIMYRTNHALTPPNTQYMMENLKGLSGIGYGHKDYSSRIHDLFRKDDPLRRINDLYSKENPQSANHLYHAALTPAKIRKV